MSTTVEVPALQAEWSSVTGRGGGGGGPRYISRLEAIKEAVCRHLDHMSVTEPHNKVSERERYQCRCAFLHIVKNYKIH